jgi:hypothetical protein
MSTHKFQIPAIKKPKINAKNTYDFFDFVKKYVTVLSIFTAIILLIAHYYYDRKENLTKLDEFSVAEVLVKKGFTSEAIRSKIMFEIDNILNAKATETSRANSMVQILNTKPVTKFEIEEKEGKGEYDVKAMIRNIKTWTFARDKVIKGHIFEDSTKDGKRWCLFLKLPKKKNDTMSISGKESLDILLFHCAKRIVEEMHPQYLVRYYLIKNKIEEADRLFTLHQPKDDDKDKEDDDLEKEKDDIKIANVNQIFLTYKKAIINRDNKLYDCDKLFDDAIKDTEEFIKLYSRDIIGYALKFAILNDKSLYSGITDTASLNNRDFNIEKALKIAIETHAKVDDLDEKFVEKNEISGWMYSMSANLIGLISDSTLISNLFLDFKKISKKFAKVKNKDDLVISLHQSAAEAFPQNAYIQNNFAYYYINPASMCFYSKTCDTNTLKSQIPNLDIAIKKLTSVSILYPNDANLKDSQAEAYLYLWQIEKELRQLKGIYNKETAFEMMCKKAFYKLIIEAVENPKDEDEINAYYYKKDFRWGFFHLNCEKEFRDILKCKDNDDCPCKSFVP